MMSLFLVILGIYCMRKGLLNVSTPEEENWPLIQVGLVLSCVGFANLMV